MDQNNSQTPIIEYQCMSDDNQQINEYETTTNNINLFGFGLKDSTKVHPMASSNITGDERLGYDENSANVTAAMNTDDEQNRPSKLDPNLNGTDLLKQVTQSLEEKSIINYKFQTINEQEVDTIQILECS